MDVCPRTLTQTPAIKLCHKVKSKKHISEKKKQTNKCTTYKTNKQTSKQKVSLVKLSPDISNQTASSLLGPPGTH